MKFKKIASSTVLFTILGMSNLHAQAFSSIDDNGVTSSGSIGPSGSMTSIDMYGTPSTGVVGPTGQYTSTNMYGNTTTGYIPGYSR